MKLRPMLPSWLPPSCALVFPNAPIRPVACYDQRRMRSWHNYLTNFGDRGICREEVVSEFEAVEGLLERHRPIAVLGESQGACIAYEVARRFGVPAIMLYGQRYVCFADGHFPVYALVGTHDDVIHARLAARTLPRDAKIVRVPLGHAETGPAVSDFLDLTLREIMAREFGQKAFVAGARCS